MRKLWIPLLALAAAAHAGTFSYPTHLDVESKGTTIPFPLSSQETVTSQTGSYQFLYNLYTGFSVFSDSAVEGSGTYDVGGHAGWGFFFGATATSVVGDTVTYTGTWTPRGDLGYGLYDSATGGGTFTFTRSPNPWAGNSYLTTTRIVGDVVFQIVPEPTTLAALALGSLALLRQRSCRARSRRMVRAGEPEGL